MNLHGYKSSIPEQESGEWKIKKFEVSKDDAERFNFSQLFNFHPERSILPGSYTSLVHSSIGMMMSDTPAELRDHFRCYYEAHGDVLINGLGLGIIAECLVDKESVDSVTVNAIDSDVLKMVHPHIDQRIIINNADALTWKPINGTRYNVVWHDIWPEINADNYDEMKLLHRRYGHWLKGTHWQGSWGKDYIFKELREERESERIYSMFRR